MRVTEIKWNDKNYSPLKFRRIGARLRKETGGRTKIDAVAWVNNRFAEFSCVYLFILPNGSMNPLEDHEESLVNEMKELLKTKEYFKLAKRIAALKRARGENIDQFIDFFRSDFGIFFFE